MRVNENLSQELYEDAGEERTRKAREYVKQGKVYITKMEYENQNTFQITKYSVKRE